MLTASQYRMRAIALLSTFVIVLVLIFMPLYPDLKPGTKTDGLSFMDNFFNSLSKYSSNFIEDERGKTAQLKDTALDATLTFKDYRDAKDKARVLALAADLAQQAAQVLSANGFQATANGNKLAVKGDLGSLLGAAVDDAELMYQNKGPDISGKYAGMNERAAIYAWYNTVNALAADFKKAGKLEQSNITASVASKALEPAYNYYQIEAKSRTKYLFPLILALGFYVLYTCWYGFGILYMFEAMGVKLSH